VGEEGLGCKLALAPVGRGSLEGAARGPRGTVPRPTSSSLAEEAAQDSLGAPAALAPRPVRRERAGRLVAAAADCGAIPARRCAGRAPARAHRPPPLPATHPQ